ncbi:MAG: DUF4402 domain-containing protein [Sphingomicrobium sp.]
MDNKSFLLALAGTSALLGSSPAVANVYIAPDQDGTGRAILLEPLSFIKVDDLDFGGFIIPSSGSGTVSVDAATGTPTNAASLVQLPQYVQQRGHFLGAGTPSQAVSVTAVLPDKLYLGGVITSPDSIDVALALDNTVAELDGSFTYTIASDQVLDVYVGGDLTIASGMNPGVYSNVYTLTVTYQ